MKNTINIVLYSWSLQSSGEEKRLTTCLHLMKAHGLERRIKQGSLASAGNLSQRARAVWRTCSQYLVSTCLSWVVIFTFTGCNMGSSGALNLHSTPLWKSQERLSLDCVLGKTVKSSNCNSHATYILRRVGNVTQRRKGGMSRQNNKCPPHGWSYFSK